MTTSTGLCRTYLQKHIALAAAVYVSPDDYDDALDQINARRPGSVLHRMTNHLRLERHTWDRKRHTTHQAEGIARDLLVRIGFEDDEMTQHLSAAMSAARGL